MWSSETPSVVWHAAFVAFSLGLMLSDTPRMWCLQRFTDTPGRVAIFRSAVVSLWVVALAALFIAGPADLLRVANHVPWLQGTLPATIGSAVLSLYFALALVPALHCALRPAARLRYGPAFRSLRHMLPVSATERRWWLLLSISAGVCEEIFFRGFLPQFLQGHLGDGGWGVGATGAWVLSALAFGICHAYQGLAGVVRTTVGGLMFGMAALLSGSLWLPIALHILIDMSILWMYRPQLDHPRAAALLMQGCDPRQGGETKGGTAADAGS